MTRLQVYALTVTALLIGNTLPRGLLFSTVEAAPSDVFGSSNVAVDTFRNTQGTYVLFADGRVVNSATGATVNARADYQEVGAVDPPLKPATLEANAGQGSPNVAVKAVTRSDGTYILFADGKFRKPKDLGVAASSLGTHVISLQSAMVPFGSPASWSLPANDIIASVDHLGGGVNYRITFKEPPDNPTVSGFVSWSTGDEAHVWGLAMSRIDDTHYHLYSNLDRGDRYSVICSIISH